MNNMFHKELYIDNRTREGFSKSRISWLDTLKGIDIILVVLFHVFHNDFANNAIYAIAMPLFFFTAGYVYRERPILIDIQRRIETILRPYFVFGTICLIYWIFIESRFRQSDMTVPQAIIGLFRAQNTWLDFNVHLWFLPCFFVMVVLFNILVKMLGINFAYGFSIILLILYLIIPMPDLPWGLNRVCKFIVFYMLGNIARRKISPEVNKNKPNSIVLVSIGIALLTVVAFLAQVSPQGSLSWYFIATVGIIGCVLLSVCFDCRLLEYLGQASIVILCFHGPIYRVLIKIESVLLNLSTEAVRENFVLVSIVIIITLLACSAIYQIVLKFFPWVIGREAAER